MKLSVIINSKLVDTSCLECCQTTYEILGNLEISEKYQNFIELLPISAQSSSRNENFVNTCKNLLKNINQTFLVVRYSTWKLEFVSNILWMIVVSAEF